MERDANFDALFNSGDYQAAYEHAKVSGMQDRDIANYLNSIHGSSLSEQDMLPYREQAYSTWVDKNVGSNNQLAYDAGLLLNMTPEEMATRVGKDHGLNVTGLDLQTSFQDQGLRDLNGLGLGYLTYNGGSPTLRGYGIGLGRLGPAENGSFRYTNPYDTKDPGNSPPNYTNNVGMVGSTYTPGNSAWEQRVAARNAEVIAGQRADTERFNAWRSGLTPAQYAAYERGDLRYPGTISGVGPTGATTGNGNTATGALTRISRAGRRMT